MANEFRARIGADGRIVIPMVCRKLLNFQADEELVLRVEEDGLHITNLTSTVKKAQALVQRYTKNQSLVEKLKALRAEDAKNE